MAAVAGSPMTTTMLTMCATGRYNHYSGVQQSAPEWSRTDRSREPGTAVKQMMNWMRQEARSGED